MKPKPLTMPIYMDHNATTPVDPRVREAMRPYFDECFGNSGSTSHAYGWQAQSAVKKARDQVATLLKCRPTEVRWTSGATESNNLAILGVVHAFAGRKPHLITQATEHKAVLEVCDAAEALGAEVTTLPVDAEGVVRPEDLKGAIRPSTVLVSIMLANNEVGALQPVREIGEICRAHKINFHCDAAQAVGKLDVFLSELSVDLLSLSAHKLYGPKGVGALIVRPVNQDFVLKPILFGGDQEGGLRPGTLNVPGIVGLGEACAVALGDMHSECGRLTSFQRELYGTIKERFPAIKLNGPPCGERLCNNLSLSFPGLHPDDLSLELSGIAFSSGSACNSARPQPSHVLAAMGLAPDLARTTLRLGMGRWTNATEVAVVQQKLLKMLESRATSA